MSIEITPGDEPDSAVSEPAAALEPLASAPPMTTAHEPDALAGFDIPASIRDSLPATVKGEIARLTPAQRDAFIEEFRRKAKNPTSAYVCWLFSLQYAYLADWPKQVIYWVTLGGFGLWIIIDLFRIGGLVKEHNKDVSADVMRDIKIMAR